MNKKIKQFGKRELKEKLLKLSRKFQVLLISIKDFFEKIFKHLLLMWKCYKQKIINFKVKNKIIWGLKKFKITIKKNTHLIMLTKYSYEY